jgi:hypothetical protein
MWNVIIFLIETECVWSMVAGSGSVCAEKNWFKFWVDTSLCRMKVIMRVLLSQLLVPLLCSGLAYYPSDTITYIYLHNLHNNGLNLVTQQHGYLALGWSLHASLWFDSYTTWIHILRL